MPEALKGNLGEQAGDNAQGVGDVTFPAAVLQVFVEGYEGIEAEAVLSDAPDEGLRLGRGPALGDVGGPLVGKFLGQAAQADHSQFLGILAFEGVDASPELRQCGHGVAS